MANAAVRQMMAVGMVLTLGTAKVAQAQAAAGQLTPETTVKLVLMDRLRSGTSRGGDRVNFRVDEDVTDANGQVLVRKGTPAYGTVVKSRGTKGFGRRGLLDFSIDYTTAVDGQRVPLRGMGNKAGKSGSKGAMATALFVSAVGGFFIKGSNVTMEPGVTLMAFVDQTVTVGAAPVPAAVAGAPMAVSAPTGPLKCLILRNGDRVTGSLESMINGVYTVATAHGTLRFAAADVREIKDAAPAGTGVQQVRSGR